MDDHPRTYDRLLREARRLVLREAALSAAAAVPEKSGYRIMVTGSLSRGQIHPWSDLDLVLVPTQIMTEPDEELRRDLRSRVRDSHDIYDADVVFHDEIFDGLKRGMLGSLILPSGIPELSELPPASVALARVHVSIGYALDQSALIMEEYDRAEAKLRPVVSDFDRMASSNAMDPLRRKASLWMKKLAVFPDGGRSPWLDDWDDEEALDRLLQRLAMPGTAPDGDAALLDAPAAGALRYLLVDAYDFVVRRSESHDPLRDYGSVRDAMERLRRDLEAMVPGVPTHGFGNW